MNIIEKAIRSIIFSLAHVLLIICDWIYDLITMIVNINFSQNSMITTMYKFSLLFLVFATTIRIIFYFAKLMNEDMIGQADFGKMFRRLGLILVTLAILPTIMWSSIKIPSKVNQIFDKNVTFTKEIIPSTAILTNTGTTSLSSDVKEYKGTEEILDLKTANKQLNKKSGFKDRQYKYFEGYGELFLLVIISLGVAMGLIMNVMQFVTRWFVIMYRYILSFLPISSLIDPSDDDSFANWIRELLTDITIQTFSLLGIKFVFGLLMTSTLSNQNAIVRILMFIGGLFGISLIGNIISENIGGTNVASKERMGQMVLGITSGAIASGAMNIGGQAVQGLGSMALDVGSGAIGSLGSSIGLKDHNELHGNDMFDDNDNSPNNKQNTDSSFDDTNDNQQNTDSSFDDTNDNPNNSSFDDTNDNPNNSSFDDFDRSSPHEFSNQDNDVKFSDDDSFESDFDGNSPYGFSSQDSSFDDDSDIEFSDDDSVNSDFDGNNQKGFSDNDNKFGSESVNDDNFKAQQEQNIDNGNPNTHDSESESATRDSQFGSDSNLNNETMGTKSNTDFSSDNKTSGLGSNSDSSTQDLGAESQSNNSAFVNVGKGNRDTTASSGSTTARDNSQFGNNEQNIGTGSQFNEEKRNNGNRFSQDNFQDNRPKDSRFEKQRLTRPDTFARQIADNKNLNTGFVGGLVNASSHMYNRATKRYHHSPMAKFERLFKEKPNIN